MLDRIKLLLKPLVWWLYILTHSPIRAVYFVAQSGDIAYRSKAMSTTITELQKFPLSIALTSAHGHPSKPIGVPAWDTSDASIATVTPAADGLSAVVSAVGALGTAVITVTVDGMTAADSVEVVAGPATAAALVAGEPVAA